MELTSVLKKAQPLIWVNGTFFSIKQLPILKLMDDKEVVEQYVEVLLDQRTHAETPEHLSLRFYTGSRPRPINSEGRGLSFGADQIAEPEDE